MLAYTEAVERAMGAIVARAHGELALVKERTDAILAQAQARVAEAEARILAVEQKIEARLAELRDGQDGAPGPAGRDGRDGMDGAEGKQGPAGERGERGEMGERGERGERGADGVGITDINMFGDDIAIDLSDERTLIIGPVVGKAGKDGAPGERGEPGPVGPAGKLPQVRAWQDAVHYEGEVVHHDGACWQAVRDTGRAPPHDDWQMIAAAGSNGADGRGFAHRGTWAAGHEYRAMDVVMIGGSSFAALSDNPGPCPGDGWQLFASRGSRGAPGERGPSGPKGDPGPAIQRVVVDEAGLLTLVNGDGTMETCDLYPLLSRLG